MYRQPSGLSYWDFFWRFRWAWISGLLSWWVLIELGLWVWRKV